MKLGWLNRLKNTKEDGVVKRTVKVVRLKSNGLYFIGMTEAKKVIPICAIEQRIFFDDIDHTATIVSDHIINYFLTTKEKEVDPYYIDPDYVDPKRKV